VVDLPVFNRWFSVVVIESDRIKGSVLDDELLLIGVRKRSPIAVSASFSIVTVVVLRIVVSPGDSGSELARDLPDLRVGDASGPFPCDGGDLPDLRVGDASGPFPCDGG